MRVLVTGGAGFIGSHVCERLLERGEEVAVIDDLNDFYSPLEKRANLVAIERKGKVDFFCVDITDPETVEQVFARVRPDAVVHLAAKAGVRPSLEQPIAYAYVNVIGCMNLLEASRRYAVTRFIFASSSSVYGDTNKVPFCEEDRLFPVSPYAATKLAGEQIAYTYSKVYGLPVTCLRFFSVYGPRQRPDLAIRKFVNRMERDEPIPVFGDGTTARDYTYVDDLVSGIIGALSYPAAFEVFNLGSSAPVQILSLIANLETIVGKKARVQWLPEQAGDIHETFADISKAAKLLGYAPYICLNEGLRKYFAWWKACAPGCVSTSTFHGIVSQNTRPP